MTKKCSRCSEVGPLSDFYLDKRAKDGRQSACAACSRLSTDAWRKVNRSHLAQYRRDYNNKNRRAVLRSKREWARKNRDRSRERRRLVVAADPAAESARQRGYREANLDKCAARDAVNNAVKRGDIVPGACSRCPEKKAEAHHPDYEKHLDVVWLCRRCHRKLHREQKEM